MNPTVESIGRMSLVPLALAILSGMDGDSFARAVHAGDLTALVALPGVGKKTAERLLVEMRDRLGDWLAAEGGGAVPSSAAATGSARVAEAEEALVALGYRPAEAARLIAAVDAEDIEGSEELIRRALKSTVRG